MGRTVILLSTLLVLACPSPALAGPKEDVAAATHAWIDAMNSRDTERVMVLYDPEAVLWATILPPSGTTSSRCLRFRQNSKASL